MIIIIVPIVGHLSARSGPQVMILYTGTVYSLYRLASILLA